jgi:hypothetical protein
MQANLDHRVSLKKFAVIWVFERLQGYFQESMIMLILLSNNNFVLNPLSVHIFTFADSDKSHQKKSPQNNPKQDYLEKMNFFIFMLPFKFVFEYAASKI